MTSSLANDSTDHSERKKKRGRQKRWEDNIKEWIAIDFGNWKQKMEQDC